MTRIEYNMKYWMFYLQLEEEFRDTLNYVEFQQDNFPTYSKEYAKQLVSIGAELDVIFKTLCEQVDSTKHRDNITNYAEVLCTYDNLAIAEVEFSINKEKYKPFEGWTPTNRPFWWDAYNKVKHHRAENDNIKKANLENVFNALAALYVLNRYLCKIVCAGRVMKEPEIKSKLFKMIGWEVCIPMGNGFMQVASADCGHVDFVFEDE